MKAPEDMPVEGVVSSNVLGDALAAMREEVDRHFDLLLPVPDDARAPLLKAMRHAAIGGGKRLRPLLLTATAEMFGVTRDAAVRAGCAVEAIHVYSLIHDDLPCMDDDDLRHGRPTVHVEFDEATAVLAGDALHALAFDILVSEQVTGDPFVRCELVGTLAKASGMNGMAGGQMMDIVAEEAGKGGDGFDLHTVTRLQQLKTGALLGAAVEMGAIMGHVAPEGRAHLRSYARDIGLAFQIADDLLDHEGDEALAGKALRKDAAAGKATFVSLLGADRAREQAEVLVQQAIGHLSGHGEEAEVLRAVARYIVERDR